MLMSRGHFFFIILVRYQYEVNLILKSLLPYFYNIFYSKFVKQILIYKYF